MIIIIISASNFFKLEAISSVTWTFSSNQNIGM